MQTFREVETAAYCPRKLYYRKREPEPEEAPAEVKQRRALAFEYDRLMNDDVSLAQAPIETTPTQFRSNLGCSRARLDCWDELVDPDDSEVFVQGRDCYGLVHKLLDPDTGSPTLSLVFAGEPPERGVWVPQSVRLMAAAKALSWEREESVERVFAEYPAYGIVREIEVDARRTATYRGALRTAKSIDGPPARTGNRSKCDACEYEGECGVRTRSLASLLGV